mmetsp:Transcript_36862/g.86747  ORF Transcript_36862/g.86747 Transcript_36862/m.86747 type:complete len:278 (+) Transcript_36862:3737-4570(+)
MLGERLSPLGNLLQARHHRIELLLGLGQLFFDLSQLACLLLLACLLARQRALQSLELCHKLRLLSLQALVRLLALLQTLRKLSKLALPGLRVRFRRRQPALHLLQRGLRRRELRDELLGLAPDGAALSARLRKLLRCRVQLGLDGLSARVAVGKLRRELLDLRAELFVLRALLLRRRGRVAQTRLRALELRLVLRHHLRRLRLLLLRPGLLLLDGRLQLGVVGFECRDLRSEVLELRVGLAVHVGHRSLCNRRRDRRRIRSIRRLETREILLRLLLH